MKTHPDPTLHVWTTKYCILSTTTIAGDCGGQASCRKFGNMWCVSEYFDPFGWRQSPHTALVCTIKKTKKTSTYLWFMVCNSIPGHPLGFPPPSTIGMPNFGMLDGSPCSAVRDPEFWNSQSTVNKHKGSGGSRIFRVLAVQRGSTSAFFFSFFLKMLPILAARR